MKTVLMFVIMGLVCRFKAPEGGFRNGSLTGLRYKHICIPCEYLFILYIFILSWSDIHCGYNRPFYSVIYRYLPR